MTRRAPTILALNGLRYLFTWSQLRVQANDRPRHGFALNDNRRLEPVA